MGEKYEKLVRDRIPEVLDAKGLAYESREASDGEFQAELIKKLREEIVEFEVAGSPEELADILEVIEALKGLPQYARVEEIRRKKKEERGGFERRLIIKGEKG